MSIHLHDFDTRLLFYTLKHFLNGNVLRFDIYERRIWCNLVHRYFQTNLGFVILLIEMRVNLEI